MLVISEEVAHSYFLHNPSVIMREVLTPSGLMSGELWSESAQSWIVQSYMPMDRCDRVSPCGPNAVCYPNTWPQCKCLPRFHPKNSINWEVIQDTSGGCVRTTALDCSNDTDGFFRKNSVKLPDTSSSSSSVNRSMSLEECQTWCLKNCSCTGYTASNISSSGLVTSFGEMAPTHRRAYSQDASAEATGAE
ncbi:receptor-like serine/threonine-protein kinase SD1-8 [Zingiber officinale]|uniref:receptor-like serine/threonine-protein kinase SD1-8 n=1 Tax=Zingiber officinale TaxID=94328 RepID=UPI001C4C8BBB|nr:receptor-like serine/threonine-protein kinase SD1-8 [Zingiber officinale]